MNCLKWIIILRSNPIIMFRKFTKRCLEARCCRLKNASKTDENYKYWRAPMTIPHTPRSSFQMAFKIIQNDLKMYLKSSSNDHKKYGIRDCNGQPTYAVVWPTTIHRNALMYVVRSVALLPPWMQISLKIVENDHKNYEARPCKGQKRTPSSDLQNASKHVNCVVRGVALFTPWMQKPLETVENHDDGM